MSESDQNWLEFSDSQQDQINKEVQKQEQKEMEQIQQNIHLAPPQLGEFKEENLFLNSQMKQKPYHRRSKETKTVYCNLFLAELYPIIYFITKNPQIKNIVFNKIAQNASIHALLSNLFPDINQHVFEVYGKSALNGIKNINLYNFSVINSKFNQLKEKINNNFLFIYILQQTKFSEVSDMNSVIEDMINRQIDIIKLIQPTQSMLNFQLPYSNEKIKFFQGKILLPICQSATSATCKIFVDQKNIKEFIEYDCVRYEQQLFYFNTEYRVSCFTNKKQLEQFDECFDCSAVQLINSLYVMYRKDINKDDKITDEEIAKTITDAIPKQQNNRKYVRCQDRKQNRQQ